MRRRELLIGVAAAVLATPALAAGDWVYLGSRTVHWGVDRDQIHVGIGKSNFDHILFEVSGNGIFIHDVDVTYSNGGHDHIVTQFHIREGGRSRSINLRGIGDRNIRRVEFTYSRPLDFDGPAKVELFGQR